MQGWDRYAYVYNNPLKYTDPNGRTPWIYLILLAVYAATNIPGDTGPYSVPESNVLAGDFALRAVSDPYDIYRTIQDCKSGSCSLFDVLSALLPVLNGGMKGLKNIDFASDIFDKIKSVGQIVEADWYMSEAAKKYQEFITGLPRGYEFFVNGAYFDGFRINEAGDIVLLDAKYSKGIGSLYTLDESFAINDILKQAYGQLDAADGIPIEWHVPNEFTNNYLTNLFEEYNINITVVTTPIIP